MDLSREADDTSLGAELLEEIYPGADEGAVLAAIETAVFLAGDFNGWQPDSTPMERVGNSGVWQAKLKLNQGTYRYRLVVDGQWQQDPYNERTELNPYGELNSVVEIH